jgi:hypothetical protein
LQEEEEEEEEEEEGKKISGAYQKIESGFFISPTNRKMAKTNKWD